MSCSHASREPFGGGFLHDEAARSRASVGIRRRFDAAIERPSMWSLEPIDGLQPIDAPEVD